MRVIGGAAAVIVALPVAPAASDELPPLLETAVEAIETSLPPEGARFAFTQTIETADAVRLVARYDPRSQDNGGWTLLEPAEDALNSQGRRVFDRLVNGEGEEMPDRALFIEQPREAVVACEGPVSAAGDVAVFACSPPADDEEMEGFRDALRAEVSVALAGPSIVGFRIYAAEAFKPAPVAKVDEMDMRMQFAPAWEGGPPRLTRVEQSTAGSAFFRRFDQSVTVTYSDVTPVE